MKERIPASLAGKNSPTVVKVCGQCGDEFLCPRGLAQRYANCSPGCSSAARSGFERAELTCGECGDGFVLPVSHLRAGRQGKFCSNDCRLAALQRVPRPLKGKGAGRLTDKGYRVINVMQPDGSTKPVSEHRWIMEQHLGRALSRREVVHHVNHDRADNRLENLVLVASQSEHLRLHHSGSPSD